MADSVLSYIWFIFLKDFMMLKVHIHENLAIFNFKNYHVSLNYIFWIFHVVIIIILPYDLLKSDLTTVHCVC